VHNNGANFTRWSRMTALFPDSKTLARTRNFLRTHRFVVYEPHKLYCIVYPIKVDFRSRCDLCALKSTRADSDQAQRRGWPELSGLCGRSKRGVQADLRGGVFEGVKRRTLKCHRAHSISRNVGPCQRVDGTMLARDRRCPPLKFCQTWIGGQPGLVVIHSE
jgi:hypothetical protein